MDRLSKRFPRYSKLLHLYPAAYRKEYGEQMLQTLADMLDDPEKSHTATWIRTSLDLPFSALKQQITYTGEAMANTTPSYIKRNALLGAWLVAPFFIFVALNSIMHNRLQNSWMWHAKALFIWLIILPGLAAIFNLLALLHWVQSRRHTTKTTAWQALADIRHNWPVLLMALVGIGILALVFGHDSVHCVAGNPIRELHNASQTWQCVQKG